MCTLAQAELIYFNATGRYASMHELRSDGNLRLPPDTRWPYRYTIHASTPANFWIIAISQRSVAGLPHALIVDASLEIRDATAAAGVIGRCESKPRGTTPESLSPVG